MTKLTERYERVMARADEFRKVIKAVAGHPGIPEPNGVGASRLTWRKQTGDTTHMAWITRIASEHERLILTIGFWTPNMHPALSNHGEHTFAEMLNNANDPRLDAALDRFADRWLVAIKEDRYAPSTGHLDA
jgi:hypothetical protein